LRCFEPVRVAKENLQARVVGWFLTQSDFSIFFSRWRPSTILDLLDIHWTTHEEYLAVFVVVLDLVGIHAAVNFDNMKPRISCEFIV